MTILKRVRTTVWETSDGQRFHDRAAAERHEKFIRLSKLVLKAVPYLPRADADSIADALLSNREGFVLALLPTKEQAK